MPSEDKKTTHFGFSEVPISEKVRRVGEVFTSVASKYDLMNDLMSFGLHRLWKQFTVSQTGLRTGQKVLDVAAGSGDLSRLFAKKVGPLGLVVLADINANMLHQGRERLLDKGIVSNVAYVQADAEQLPFPNHYFDCVSIAFGLRNVTDKTAALRSMYRVLKPGGKLLVLEFSKPMNTWLEKAYDIYSFNVIPMLGEWICKDKESYQYLVESIRVHPNQEQLKKLMTESGFEDVEYHNLTGGVVALHKGFKY
jgi:demethylmenaquinone methyltransferase / 2-methoxy-6-polyprenyl-1,4-benzoquinol methylase